MVRVTLTRSNGLGNQAQMMVLETIFFTATVILSLVFLYQLSPPSVVNEIYTDDLNDIGEDALNSIYNNNVVEVDIPGYPRSKMVHYLIANEYVTMISNLGNLLPSTVMYNIYISNGVDTIFWCDCLGNTNVNEKLMPAGSVSISSCIVAIDPVFLSSGTNELLRGDVDADNVLPECSGSIPECSGSIYEVQLKMWYI